MTPHASHQEFTDLFSDYYDGELDGEARGMLEAHLASCSDCRDEYASFKTSLDGLHNLNFTFAPDDFVQQVTTSINRQSRGAFFRDSWLFGFRIPYEIFAVLLLAIIAALYVFGPANPVPLQVDDLPRSASPSEPEDPAGGHALGPASRQLVVELPATVDLGALARALRADGFRPRPELSDAGERLVVSVPSGQLARFAERLNTLSEADTTELLRLATQGSSQAVDVRLSRPFVPTP